MYGGHHQLALVPVLGAVEPDQRVTAHEKLDGLVGLSRPHRIAGVREDLLGGLGLRERNAGRHAWKPRGVDVAEALAAILEKTDRIARLTQELPQRRFAGARRDQSGRPDVSG